LIYKNNNQKKPDWYIEDSWIRKDILMEKYNDLYEEVSKRAFSIMFKDKLYKSEKRPFVHKNRHTFIKLLKRSDL